MVKSHRQASLAQTLFRIAAMLCTLALLLQLFSGETGLVQNYLLKGEADVLHRQIALIEQQNQQQMRVIESLKNDLQMAEYIARYDLGLIGENEILFIFSK